MPFFKFRRGDASSAPPAGSAAQAQSVEVLRKRAKHRLIGASVLVLLGVVGFPMLFDTQPRPISVDIPIEIPGKNPVKPLVITAPPVALAPETAAAVASLLNQEEIPPPKSPPPLAEPVPPAIKKEVKPEPRPEAKTEVKPEPKAEAKTEVKPPVKPAVAAETKPAPQADVTGDDGARARALLNGTAVPQAPKVAAVTRPAVMDDTKAAAAAETKGRMVVQVGAFADVAKAEETRRKLEKAGLKTYTQVADTKDGKRIRVRVGPFASKAEAEKAASKIRSLDLPVAILSF